MTDHFTNAYNALLAMRDAASDADQLRTELDIKTTELTRITTLLVGAGYRTLADIDHALASLIELRDMAERQQEALRIAGYEGADALSRVLERLGVLEDAKVDDVMRQMEPRPTIATGTGNTLPMSGCEVPKTTRVETLGWASRK